MGPSAADIGTTATARIKTPNKFFIVGDHITRRSWGGPPGLQPTPSSACLLAPSGSGGTRADQGSAPQRWERFQPTLRRKGPKAACVSHYASCCGDPRAGLPMLGAVQ